MERRFVSLSPRVLIFPFPVQGHVNSMLKLAEILSLAGLRITFLNSDYSHHRLLRYSNILDRFTRYAGFRFQTISDGLPLDYPRTGIQLKDMFDGMKATMKPLFREMIMSSSRNSDPVTCIIADGIMGFAIDVGNEVGVPTIVFRTSSACAFWAYFSLPKLIEAGEVPFKDDDMDRPVTSVAGMEGFLRRRDLPSFCRSKDVNDYNLQLVMTETRQSPRANAVIFNTFEALEAATLSQIRTQCPNIYTIGPLHAHLKSRLTSEETPSSNSLWEEDKSCIPWLDRQPSKSVLYVSFGSLVVITREELMEFWHGLVNSGCRFLWVIRPDSLTGKDGGSQPPPPAQLWEATKERGQIVGWAPQEEVLVHPAVGGFLTHSGWNSTIESISAGVPMICWPYISDQRINSRFVSHVWKVGMDMKDTCDRLTVEKMVRDLMENKRTEFTESANAMAKLARSSLTEGGSSFCNLSRMIENIRLMSA